MVGNDYGLSFVANVGDYARDFENTPVFIFWQTHENIGVDYRGLYPLLAIAPLFELFSQRQIGVNAQTCETVVHPLFGSGFGIEGKPMFCFWVCFQAVGFFNDFRQPKVKIFALFFFINMTRVVFLKMNAQLVTWKRARRG